MRKKVFLLSSIVTMLVIGLLLFSTYAHEGEPTTTEDVPVTRWEHPTGEEPTTFEEWKKDQPSRQPYIERENPPSTSPTPSPDEEPATSEDIPVTQWSHPTEEQPTTFEEWKKSQPLRETHIERKYPLLLPPPPQTNMVYILVNPALYPSIEASLLQYVQDLSNEGYPVQVFSVSFSTEQELRSFLAPPGGLVGCVLIGDFPVAWYEMDNPSPWGHEEFPIDLFLMDLDGTWTDADSDGMFDGHSGDTAPEIWVGRLSASNLTLNGADEVSLLNNYFFRNHAYRMGTLALPDRALLYVDDDWVYWAGGWDGDLGLIYGDRVLVSDEATTRRYDYLDRLTEGYEWIQLHAHSSAWTHTFYYPVAQTEHVYNYDIKSTDPHTFFYNLFACSAARYIESDYIGGWYVFADTYGIAAVGSTKTGSMLNFDDFYRPLSLGESLGEAFEEWFTANGESDPKWFYGMTLLGDPTIKPFPHTIYMPVIMKNYLGS